ncbi:unnamed protein product [Cuscuta campestris]|uniref:Uncharacterized protein n=1 Tax=Cuscuta campestris TaxID=132261 RepID=A0A484LVQ0_9ASTE|nr:unnamed protein product [Cuscuta campestris]
MKGVAMAGDYRSATTGGCRSATMGGCNNKMLWRVVGDKNHIGRRWLCRRVVVGEAKESPSVGVATVDGSGVERADRLRGIIGSRPLIFRLLNRTVSLSLTPHSIVFRLVSHCLSSIRRISTLEDDGKLRSGRREEQRQRH